MPARLPEFAAFVLDQLSPIPSLSHSRMFGGIGLRAGETFFAILMSGELYFVVDEQTRREYEALGSGAFTYQKKTGLGISRRYYRVPAEVLDEPERLLAFASASIAAVRRGKAPAARRSRRKT
ncbi:TfoX/Sxy family protein [Solimonas terrae]|uniref:TfoX/Sxy family protein n=1 Tax=Solimonas terrae TaxID=1396819 RepID=A0A6M2BU04_9GAMM|nr:TfoX/Sxy family protein [Solimonas terrae]NGY05691.1 TfoX/Sxy family protein [Solimonas terrae]